MQTIVNAPVDYLLAVPVEAAADDVLDLAILFIPLAFFGRPAAVQLAVKFPRSYSHAPLLNSEYTVSMSHGWLELESEF